MTCPNPLFHTAKGEPSDRNMEIKKARKGDIHRILRIYECARRFMRENGNQEQWGNAHPPRELIEEDIRQGKLYVCMDEGRVDCVFYFNREDDATYRMIEDGAWLSGEPYGVVHRIASVEGRKGAATCCLNWAFEQTGNIRIDTHEDNKPMRGLLEKLGFVYCGIIRLKNGSPRMAFQKTR